MLKKSLKITLLVLIVLLVYLASGLIPGFFLAKGYDIERRTEMQIIAHRGGESLGSENTLACIRHGLAGGADMIEIDIHLTKDNYIVICHDTSVNRTTNGSGEIRDMTLAELRKLRIVDNAGNLTDELIPTLAEVLDLVKDQAKLLVEIKQAGDRYDGLELLLMNQLKAFGDYSWVIIQSFNDSVLEKIHALNPEQRLEKLFVFKVPGLPIIFDVSFNSFSYEKYSYISSFNINYTSVTTQLVEEIHAQGKEVKIWTVKDPDSTPDLPVDGVITSSPELWTKK